MKDKLSLMFEMQYQINTKIAKDWIDRKFDWHRAIWVECGELLDHIGYKWWKHQEADMEQSKLELVDIFHFGISKLYTDNPERTTEELVDSLLPIFERLNSTAEKQLPLQAVEELAGAASFKKVFSPEAFVKCMRSLEMTFDDLYIGYVSKNVLNTFRQDYGYKSGEYVKHWDGKEDNEHLMDVLNSQKLDVDNKDFPNIIYQGLAKKYPVQKQL